MCKFRDDDKIRTGENSGRYWVWGNYLGQDLYEEDK